MSIRRVLVLALLLCVVATADAGASKGQLAGVTVSATELTRGDVLAVRVESQLAYGTLSGSFINQQLHFYPQADGSWLALLGVSLYIDKGTYTLKVAADSGKEVGLYSQLIKVRQGKYGSTNITLPPAKNKLTRTPVLKAERQLLARLFERSVWSELSGSLAVWPLASAITLPYGNANQVNGKLSYYHGGVDFRASPGTPIGCAAPGRVLLAENLNVRGNTVFVDHGRGLISGYFHLESVAVAPGAKVQAKTVLGRSGETGFASGPHLHFEVRLHGVQVNPFDPLILGHQAQ